MDAEAQQILEERFARLPQKIQDAITSADLRQQLKSIADKHQLHIDQADVLEDEVVLVMLGLQSGEDFIEHLVSEARVEREDALQIADMVNGRILLPIRDELQKVQERDVAAEETGPDTAAQPSSPSAPTSGEPDGAASKEEPAMQNTAPQESTPVSPQQPQAEVPTPKRPSFANKLKERTAMRAQETEVGRKQGTTDAQEGQPQYRTSDPYREPIEEADLNKPIDGVQ